MDTDKNGINVPLLLIITILFSLLLSSFAQAQLVSIPDPNLAAAIRQEIGDSITTDTILNLTRLDARNRGITGLTGLEHAHNLRELYLSGKYVETEQRIVNSNAISDFSPITGLTQMTALDLSFCGISDVSFVSGLTQLTWLDLNYNSISDISALANLRQLNQLSLLDNTISDVSPLAELKKLTYLYLWNNSISDISAFVKLTQLNQLYLNGNIISDISPLAELKKLDVLNLSFNNISDVSPLLKLNLTGTEWDRTGLYIERNPLNYAAINTHIPAMQAQGIVVKFDQRTPTTLIKISGIAQQGIINTALPLPFVVEVRDQQNKAFSGVPVTFSVATGDGKLSATTVPTDAAGRAAAHLTLGRTAGTTTVRVAAAEISQPVQFTATGVLLSPPVTITDANLREKIIEALDKPQGGTLTVADMLKLTALVADNADIRDLTGLQHASNLKILFLDNNNISDISRLGALTHLIALSLNSNNISDLTPLGVLPQLEVLLLDNNNISDVIPLAVLTELKTLSLNNNNISNVVPLETLTQLKTLQLKGNLLSYPSLHIYIPAIQTRGGTVKFDPRTPTTLLNISEMQGVVGTAHPIGVEVQDAHGFGFSEVPVTFTVTAGGGQLNTSNVIADSLGRAWTILTLGPAPGKNTVRVAAAEGLRPISFSITAVDVNPRVRVPDANLHTKIAETLNKAPGVQLNTSDMLRLTRLEAQNADIQNLTGLEHAHNLRNLNLSGEYIETEQRIVNSNAISDFSPITGLTQLTDMNLSFCNISDVSFVSGLTQLTWLDLGKNSISDISALANLKQLNQLYLWGNRISDVSPLAELKKLTHLYLGNNSISDISPFAKLTQLTGLYLSSNGISDVSALAELKKLDVLDLNFNNISDIAPLIKLNLAGTQWDRTGLYIAQNPLNYAAINTYIRAMQAEGIVVKFDPRVPATLEKISGIAQQGIVNTALPLPFAVEVRDQQNKAFSGVPVTFTITTGGGKLSATTIKTDTIGMATARLTMGQTAGTTTVRVTAPDVSQPVQFTATAILRSASAPIRDANLRAKIAETLRKPSGATVTVTDMLKLRTLTANDANIYDLTGLQHAANLTTLSLNNNYITEGGPLAALTQLTALSLDNNSLWDLEPLTGLTELTMLSLEYNSLSDIKPVTVLPQLKTLHLRGNWLDNSAYDRYIPAMQMKGIDIRFDPRTKDPRPVVRLIYFYPSDRKPLPDVDERLDRLIKEAQQFYADQMEAHGFDRKTFLFETDTQERAVIHHVKGRFSHKDYQNNWQAAWHEAEERFYRLDSLLFTVLDVDFEGITACGKGGGNGRAGRGFVTARECFNVSVIAHELGHAFGLYHDYTRTDGKWIPSQYSKDRMMTSFCAAEWLNVIPIFNTGAAPINHNTTVKMLPPKVTSPPNIIRLSFEINDPDGIQQIQFSTNEPLRSGEMSVELADYKGLKGNPGYTVEFFTTQVKPKNKVVIFQSIDVHGNTTRHKFPVDSTSLFPPPKVVLIPDPHLASVVREEIGSITTHTMLDLMALDVPNHGIKDLTGLEHAHNLRRLNLSGQYIEGEGTVNSNAISDVSPLGGLKQLTWLILENNTISDVSPLAALTQLNELRLGGNIISDIAPLAELKKLTSLYLWGNKISDVSPLAELKKLGVLDLSFNNISDIAPLVKLNLTGTEWDRTGLHVIGNPLSAVSINTHIPAMQAKGIIVAFDGSDGALAQEISGEKIVGPWLWVIAPTGKSGADAAASGIDFLSEISDGAVTEAKIATEGATAGSPVSDSVWTLHTLSATDSDNINDMAKATGLGIGNIDYHVAYGSIALDAPREQQTIMLAGSDDAVKVWLNGELVHNNPVNRGARDFQDQFPVTLKKGTNILLVAVYEGQGAWAGFFGFAADAEYTLILPSSPRPAPSSPRPAWDVNEDGVVDAKDITPVTKALRQEQPENPRLDVNSDGVVDAKDLALVVERLGDGDTPAASSHPAPPLGFTLESVEQTLNILRAADDGTLTFKRGIANLEQLLAHFVPENTALLHNYPNPFNPETWIPYQLAKPAEVTLYIYAVNGALVRTLSIGYQPAGMYRIQSRAAYWDGRNALGERVVSGLYFYTFTAGEFTATRKMLILK